MIEPEDQPPVEWPITDTLDLHTVLPRDVAAVVEAWLDEVHLRGYRELRIIHGKGIGAQRETVRRILGRTSFVAAFRDAPLEAGSWGATIVDLR